MEKITKFRVGKVLSTKMQKTVTVGIELPQRDPLYGKRLRKSVKYKAHCEGIKCKVGDIVRIMETRPISKDKTWKVLQVVRKGEFIGVKPGEIETEEMSEQKK
ncbi:MAG: 30S ribosomal protein S17 [Chloroflexi bacterium]|nr:30S ribosomal protein S17 [Chloroflexota bacterium]